MSNNTEESSPLTSIGSIDSQLSPKRLSIHNKNSNNSNDNSNQDKEDKDRKFVDAEIQSRTTSTDTTNANVNTTKISRLLDHKNYLQYFRSIFSWIKHNSAIIQKIISIIATLSLFILLPKLLSHDTLSNFLSYMHNHPIRGIILYVFIYPLHMVLLLPGTPMVLGAGYVFKSLFGWLMGVTICSIFTLLGSLFGSLLCFLLGRFWLRSWVRRWRRKYPMFEAIDAAVSDNGFKIMCLLYLTPVVPLGPVSYMMGTTSMPILDFAKAKFAALPLTVLYVYLGAATGTLVVPLDDKDSTTSQQQQQSLTNGQKYNRDMMDINKNNISGISNSLLKNTTMLLDGKSDQEVALKEDSTQIHSFEDVSISPTIIVIGIFFSVISISFITYKMKKELQKILDAQRREKDSITDVDLHSLSNETGATNILSNANRRHRHHLSKPTII